MNTKQQIAQQRANLAIAEFLKELFTPPYVISESTFDEQLALRVRCLQEMQASHYAIAAHWLIVLAEVNTVSQDWGNLLFKLSLAEALEEISSSITEEAWLYNEYSFYMWQ